jgi:Immunoglobulin I-set domain
MRTQCGRFFRNLTSQRLVVVCLWAVVWLLMTFLSARVASGQGTVTFYNHVLGGGGPITHVWAPLAGNSAYAMVGLGPTDTPSGTTPFSPANGWSPIGSSLIGQYGAAATRSQLLAAPGADQPESNLLPAAPTATFRSGAASGFVVSSVATLSNVPKDAPVATLQMVAWDNSAGLYPTWTEAYPAWLSGLIAAGKSAPFNVYKIGGDTNQTPALVGLQSFNLFFSAFNTWPNLVLEPQGQTASVGQSVTFNAFATCSAPVTYQWRLNGEDIAGATNRVFIIPSAHSEDAGSYSVLAVTAYLGALSSNAVLAVQGAPSIVTQPQDRTVLVGQAANFSVTAAGTPTLLYQWQFNGTNLAGRTDSSLTLTNVQLNQAGAYLLVVSNSYGSATSSPAHLAVADTVLLNAYPALELEFTTRTNTTYYIQASPDYNVWTNFDGPIYGNGQAWSKTYSTRASGKLFYRVWWIP